jgi:hypothetical protein
VSFDIVTPEDESDPASYIVLFAVLFSKLLAPDSQIVLSVDKLFGWWLESETILGWFCLVLRYLDILRDIVVSGLVRFTNFATAYNKQANAQTLHLINA